MLSHIALSVSTHSSVHVTHTLKLGPNRNLHSKLQMAQPVAYITMRSEVMQEVAGCALIYHMFTSTLTVFTSTVSEVSVPSRLRLSNPLLRYVQALQGGWCWC